MCRQLMGEIGAELIALIVLSGEGSGFSIALDDRLLDRDIAIEQLPSLLRALAGSIEQENRETRRN
jgi:hypothetical protein